MADTFQFKNFVVYQDHCAMKVGTDAVLLGTWARGGKHILDIGSGTGVISLMMAQRYANAAVEGVEINSEAADQSHSNAALSPYADRIVIHNVSLQQFAPSGVFDSIVTNPPYFDNCLPSPETSRRQARQNDDLPFGDIFAFARQWLSDKGELSAIIPYTALEQFSEQAFFCGFFLARQFDVRTVRRKQPKRVLLSFAKSRPPVLDRQTITLMEDDGSRTAEYKSLTKDFYLDP